MLLTSDYYIDECVGSPCKNGATCRNIPGSHKCICKAGFKGRDCGKVNFKKAINNFWLLYGIKQIDSDSEGLYSNK